MESNKAARPVVRRRGNLWTGLDELVVEEDEDGEVIQFFIAGIPRPTQTGSTIRVGKRSFPTYRNTEWAGYCRLAAAQMREKILEGPVVLELTFFLPRPKKPKCEVPITRPDLDNLQKKLLDGFNGILWRDDSQVVESHVKKRYADQDGPGLLVQVRAYEL